MDALLLKKEWKESDTHKELGNKILVTNKDELYISCVKVMSDFSNYYGVHLEFVIDKTLYFISVVKDSICKINPIGYNLSFTLCDIKIANYQKDHNDWLLKVSISNTKNNDLLEIECKSLSIGPIIVKRIA